MGATASEADEAEHFLNLVFPKSFKDFHAVTDGFEYCDMDENMFSLWSYDRIVKEYSEGTDPNWISICDYLISSHMFGYRKGHIEVFKEYDGSFIVVANNFPEFIRLLIQNDDCLY